MEVKQLILIILRIAFVFLSVIFFPLGIFMLGYLVGRGRKDKNKTLKSVISEVKTENDEKFNEDGAMVI